jgi:hypothetical protein
MSEAGRYRPPGGKKLRSHSHVLAVFPLRLLTGNAARSQNGSASTGKLIQSIVCCRNRSNGRP